MMSSLGLGNQVRYDKCRINQKKVCRTLTITREPTVNPENRTPKIGYPRHSDSGESGCFGVLDLQ